MSALAEALVAAQRRALSALEKQYAAVKLEADEFRDKLVAIGLTDDVDADRLIAALDLIRDYGAALPSEPTNGAPPKADEPATDAQLALGARLVKEKNVTGPDLPITKAQAHEVIDTGLASSYALVSSTSRSAASRSVARVTSPSLFQDGDLIVAKRSRSGRVWKITGRRMGEYRQISPQGATAGVGFGGVKAIWKTDADLAERFERA